jgi:predicted nucleic acid-binding protein
VTIRVVDTSVASFMLDDLPELDRYRTELSLGVVVYVSFQTVAELRFGALNRRWGVTSFIACALAEIPRVRLDW